jgi:aspartate oxidase
LIDMICGKGTFLRRFAGIYSRYQKYNINPVIEPILVYPTQHYQNGGIEIDITGETSVPNLLGAGEVTGGVHGHNRLGSNSLVDIFVFGRRAGRHAAEKIKTVKTGKMTLDHLNNYKKQLEDANIVSDKVSPLILPDYRFEKALTTVQHIKGH